MQQPHSVAANGPWHLITLQNCSGSPHTTVDRIQSLPRGSARQHKNLTLQREPFMRKPRQQPATIACAFTHTIGANPKVCWRKRRARGVSHVTSTHTQGPVRHAKVTLHWTCVLASHEVNTWPLSRGCASAGQHSSGSTYPAHHHCRLFFPGFQRQWRRRLLVLWGRQGRRRGRIALLWWWQRRRRLLNIFCPRPAGYVNLRHSQSKLHALMMLRGHLLMQQVRPAMPTTPWTTKQATEIM